MIYLILILTLCMNHRMHLLLLFTFCMCLNLYIYLITCWALWTWGAALRYCRALRTIYDIAWCKPRSIMAGKVSTTASMCIYTITIWSRLCKGWTIILWYLWWGIIYWYVADGTVMLPYLWNCNICHYGLPYDLQIMSSFGPVLITE